MAEPASFHWDSSALEIKRWLNNDGYVPQFVEKLHLEPDWTVLDVGCGPGDISFRVAPSVKQVTALDFSAKLLELLQQEIRARNIRNIVCLNTSWDKGDAAVLAVHDVVIASRSIGTMQDKKQALFRLNHYARRYVYLTLGSATTHTLRQEINRALGKAPDQSTGLAEVLNLLQSMKISPNIEYLHGRSHFVDLQDAVDNYTWAKTAVSPVRLQQVARLLSDNLIENRDGSLEFPYDDLCWALLWWRKA
jgi:SAM-dependent methyltransferase